MRLFTKTFGSIHLNYLIKIKNLHNLLWIYAPDRTDPTSSLHSPGDDYVDIVALDVYLDDPVKIASFPCITHDGKTLDLVRKKKTSILLHYSIRITAIQNVFALFTNAHVVNHGDILKFNRA